MLFRALRHRTRPARPARPAKQTSGRTRGQVLVIFAMSVIVFLGLSAVVVDVAWYWANSLRMQRAADAAALAGVVKLPGDPASAILLARNEAAKNGYINGGGVVVDAQPDSQDPRRMQVAISGPVNTYFARLLGITTFPAARHARAEFILPVPMGSPENYYGVFGTIRSATYTSPQSQTNSTNTGWRIATAWPAGGTWTSPSRANATDDNLYAVSSTVAGSLQQWSTFGFTLTPTVTAIDGIEMQVRALYTGSGFTTTNCRLDASLSWDAGVTWTAVKSQTLSGFETLYTLGSTSDDWGHAWTVSQLSDANFRARLAFNKVSCSSTRTASVDVLQLRTTYKYGTTVDVTQNLGDVSLKGPGTACANGRGDCFNPDGVSLNPRGFWGTMNTQGAANVNGDAHQPYYDTNTSAVAPACPAGDSRSCYDPNQYYNYAVEMPPGSTNGYVYVFDPGFCATANNAGTGDRWFGGGNNAVSSWYELLNTQNTPYNLSDDTVIASSDTMFMSLRASDPSMGGPATGSGVVDCRRKSTTYGDGRDYHNSWYLLNPGAPLSGGTNGRIYRLHTTGTDPRVGGSPTSQQNTNGEQSFSLFVNATLSGSTGPRIYGLGAMQMFTPLSSSGGATQSEFYLAQIAAEHAGKTMEIELWDPGDTSPLTANVQILIPTSGGWTPTTLAYSAKVGTTNSSANAACNTNASSSTSQIATEATGSQPGEFNGCWLKIRIVIPSNYAAYQSGWWKIRYNMTGNGTSNDVTTWKVSVRGNPVHLIVP